jgi:cytoskeletal protein CcmA (bactofilin family)
MKFKKAAGDEILSVLGEGVELQGELSFSGGLRVDGAIKGKIHSEGVLVVGPKGKVEAEVHVQRASLRGEFHGVIHASDRIEIHTEGKVHGDLYTPCLIIEAGALFEGKCNMGERKGDASILKAVENLN